jgi:hypothetical protein
MQMHKEQATRCRGCRERENKRASATHTSIARERGVQRGQQETGGNRRQTRGRKKEQSEGAQAVMDRPCLVVRGLSRMQPGYAGLQWPAERESRRALLRLTGVAATGGVTQD